ncbi:kinesin-like protein KIN-8A isoform X2 [Senna tora]|uniref:Kinesin-like protein n=1 Tax=Senna tora TaxID=362788 RepID=A0A834W586_9FABA|nr:kinesin-like protein KIN-8A isoform X2 [Senna tora]
MPVSTRSQIIISQGHQNEPITEQRIRNRGNHQEDGRGTTTTLPLKNPHHGLKEKMKALTLLYEQQKQASLALKNSSFKHHEDPRFTTHPSVQLLGGGDSSTKQHKQKPKPHNVMRENTIPNSNITRTFVVPQPPEEEDSKENLVAGTDRIVGFTCPRKPTAVARKLSLGATTAPPPEVKGNGGGTEESEKIGKIENRILVFVRLRPMGKKEKEAGSRCCVKIVNRREVYLTEFASENDYLRLNRLRGRHFTFDASFPDSATQQEVYSTTTSELVEAVLQGRNGSVFCYGATGAGKTYTMLGTMENPGVMVLAIKDLFSKIRQRSFDGNHEVHLSYLEVYNETVRDLLSPGRPLVLREDKQGIVAAGLTQYRAYSTDEVMALLQQGNQNRTTEPTRVNETSSRSHAILQVVVEYRVRDGAMNVINRVGKLSLIDLAGSERALATDQRTVRSLEGANINRSLLALSSCINALVEGKKHIPYRNSKLTQLLKDSLGGTCNTVMIANISPSHLSFGETQNTLHWADRAKEIRTKACDTSEDVMAMGETETEQAKLVLELQKENRELRMQLAKQQQKLLILQAQSLAANASSSPTPPSATTTGTTTRGGTLRPKETNSEMRSLLVLFRYFTCVSPEAIDRRQVSSMNSSIKHKKLLIDLQDKEVLYDIDYKDEFIHLDFQSKKKGKMGSGVTLRKLITVINHREEKKKSKGEGGGGVNKSTSHIDLRLAVNCRFRRLLHFGPFLSSGSAAWRRMLQNSHDKIEVIDYQSKLLVDMVL